MSKFNIYAKKIDKLARKAFEEYAAAETELKKAESAYRAFPQRVGGTENADCIRAKADFLDAQKLMNSAKRRMDGYNDNQQWTKKMSAARGNKE